jgi:hypothetical protein
MLDPYDADSPLLPPVQSAGSPISRYWSGRRRLRREQHLGDEARAIPISSRFLAAAELAGGSL